MFLLRVLGLLGVTSAKIGFVVVFLAAEVVGVIGRLDTGSMIFGSDPVLRRTIIDWWLALSCFDDAVAGFDLDDDGRDGCFVRFVFARLAGLFAAF